MCNFFLGFTAALMVLGGVGGLDESQISDSLLWIFGGFGLAAFIPLLNLRNN